MRISDWSSDVCSSDLLVREIAKAKHGDRLKVYYPRTAKREAIYVHAKTAVVDDRMIRVGSVNTNNRSMGLDSESDVTIAAALPAHDRTEPVRRTQPDSLLPWPLATGTSQGGPRDR